MTIGHNSKRVKAGEAMPRRLRSFIERLEALDLRLRQINLELAQIESAMAGELGLPPCNTYVIAGGDTGLVKIGKSVDVQARLSSLQSGSPVPLRLLRVIRFDCEQLMHRRFDHLRTRGEWFAFDERMLTEDFSQELMAMIAEAA